MGGQRSGFGTFTFHNKTCQYKGEWKAGMYSGPGTLQWQITRELVDSDSSTINKIVDRHKYVGNFEKGLFEGEGVHFENDEVARQGTWHKGKFVTVDDNADEDENRSVDTENKTTRKSNVDDSDQSKESSVTEGNDKYMDQGKKNDENEAPKITSTNLDTAQDETTIAESKDDEPHLIAEEEKLAKENIPEESKDDEPVSSAEQ